MYTISTLNILIFFLLVLLMFVSDVLIVYILPYFVAVDMTLSQDQTQRFKYELKIVNIIYIIVVNVEYFKSLKLKYH